MPFLGRVKFSDETDSNVSDPDISGSLPRRISRETTKMFAVGDVLEREGDQAIVQATFHETMAFGRA